MGFLSDQHIHTVIEAAKLAFADREAWYGDPDFADVPLAALLDPDYAEQRRKLIGDEASLELRPGSPRGQDPRLPSFIGHAPADAKVGVANPADTCHVDVLDQFGNMVSATPSGAWLHSSPVIKDLGFCLGTRAQMFNLDEGHRDALQPGKRPRTTLSPSLVTRGNDPWLAFGTPGGDQQDQWTFNFFLAHSVFGLNLQEAIDAPTFHTTHFPSSFFPRQSAPGHLVIEDRIDVNVGAALAARGHDLEVVNGWSLGKTCAVGLDPKTGQLMAAANPRGQQCYAVGR
jgi:gamma-glutamyltranspeptidase/glutathione hydrolase